MIAELRPAAGSVDDVGVWVSCPIGHWMQVPIGTQPAPKPPRLQHSVVLVSQQVLLKQHWRPGGQH